ncbi:protein amnionless [Discoglossus pictus]
MDSLRFLLIFLPLVEQSTAVYKQWIPNTNYENISNWREHRVPCAQDKVMFEKDKRVSVYVQSLHALTDLYMPWEGEFILAPGAGFSASSRYDPNCGTGSTVTFQDSDQHQWVDPTLWVAALSTDDLEDAKHLFSVDAERVPCQFDDVIFPPESSFRVNFQSMPPEISLKSVSVMGRRFTRDEEFAQHLQTQTGQLQFPGSVPIKVTNSKCRDRTGCVCGTDGMIQEICSALLKHTENKCPVAPCLNALRPLGHCCEICGGAISLEYAPGFDLDVYRNRLIHAFLSLPKYSGVKLAISKVQQPQRILGIMPRESAPEIQIVLLDDKMGAQTGSDAVQLAYDIMSDIDKHGESFGIVAGTLQVSGGTTSGAQGGHLAGGSIAGIVLGIILGLALLGTIIFLYRTGTFSFSSFTFFHFWSRTHEPDMDNITFENPIFDPTIEGPADAPGLHLGEEALGGTDITQSSVQFSNPLYGNTQCEV